MTNGAVVIQPSEPQILEWDLPQHFNQPHLGVVDGEGTAFDILEDSREPAGYSCRSSAGGDG